MYPDNLIGGLDQCPWPNTDLSSDNESRMFPSLAKLRQLGDKCVHTMISGMVCSGWVTLTGTCIDNLWFFFCSNSRGPCSWPWETWNSIVRAAASSNYQAQQLFFSSWRKLIIFSRLCKMQWNTWSWSLIEGAPEYILCSHWSMAIPNCLIV